ncbi:MAG: hypothetical protein M1540_01150 [Candidatus Bathyarchaeota archaeon]|nr:hypothetical protein [Candidatus Bathyarchaeota archaeon]
MAKKKAPDEVRASKEFNAYYAGLNRAGEVFKRINACIDSIKENWQVGDKVGREKFPDYYVVKYGINNLYRLEVGDCRLAYTIIADGCRLVAVVLEYFESHKEYSERFGYDD